MATALKLFRIDNRQKQVGNKRQRYDKDYFVNHALHPALSFLFF
jgi:hypothetical protein